MILKYFFVLIFIFAQNSNTRILLNKSMASINNEIITLSDVFLFGQINFLLSQQFKSSSEILDKIPVSLDRNKIAQLTKDLIVVEILNQELIKFNMGHIDPETAVKNFLSLFPVNIS